MKTRMIRYDTIQQMECGVERLSDEGWILRRLVRMTGDVSLAEFARNGAPPSADCPDRTMETA